MKLVSCWVAFMCLHKICSQSNHSMTVGQTMCIDMCDHWDSTLFDAMWHTWDSDWRDRWGCICTVAVWTAFRMTCSVATDHWGSNRWPLTETFHTNCFGVKIHNELRWKNHVVSVKRFVVDGASPILTLKCCAIDYFCATNCSFRNPNHKFLDNFSIDDNPFLLLSSLHWPNCDRASFCLSCTTRFIFVVFWSPTENRNHHNGQVECIAPYCDMSLSWFSWKVHDTCCLVVGCWFWGLRQPSWLVWLWTLLWKLGAVVSGTQFELNPGCQREAMPVRGPRSMLILRPLLS